MINLQNIFVRVGVILGRLHTRLFVISLFLVFMEFITHRYFAQSTIIDTVSVYLIIAFIQGGIFFYFLLSFLLLIYLKLTSKK